MCAHTLLHSLLQMTSVATLLKHWLHSAWSTSPQLAQLLEHTGSHWVLCALFSCFTHHGVLPAPSSIVHTKEGISVAVERRGPLGRLDQAGRGVDVRASAAVSELLCDPGCHCKHAPLLGPPSCASTCESCCAHHDDNVHYSWTKLVKEQVLGLSCSV